MLNTTPSVATCIDQASYSSALTRGKQYTVLAYDAAKQQFRVQGDNGRRRWFPALCFDLTGQPCPIMQSFSIDDPIHDPQHDCIEVTVRLSDGQVRWCFFVTPRWLVTALTQGPPPKQVEKHGLQLTELTYLDTTLEAEDGTQFGLINVPHMIVISDLSEATLARALGYIDSQNDLAACTLPLVGE
jgi:hypothetical protein